MSKLCGLKLSIANTLPLFPFSIIFFLFHPQLPEPIIPFRLYNSLMGLAKESLQGEVGTPVGKESESRVTVPVAGKGPELVDLGPDTDPEALVLVEKLKELLRELPKANMATLRYIAHHLRRSVAKWIYHGLVYFLTDRRSCSN